MKMAGHKPILIIFLALLILTSCTAESDTDSAVQNTKLITEFVEQSNPENSLYIKKLSKIIYKEYLNDCKSDNAPSWFKGMSDDEDTYISATCNLVDLTGNGVDELIIHKQTYGGVMWTEFVVYSVEDQKKLLYLYQSGIDFNLHKNTNDNTVVEIENEFTNDTEEYFFEFGKSNASNYSKISNTIKYLYIGDNVSLMYFHKGNVAKELFEFFDGKDLKSYDNSDSYEKELKSYIDTLQKYEIQYTEFKLSNKDFISETTIEKTLQENLIMYSIYQDKSLKK